LNSQESQEPGGYSLEQMSPAQVASLERVQAHLMTAGWELSDATPPWRNRSAMTPELHAEYDANPVWWMGIGWYMSREYVELQLRTRAVGGDPAPGRGLVWRAYPRSDGQRSWTLAAEAMFLAVIDLQDGVDEQDWSTFPAELRPLSEPLLFEVPGGFLVDSGPVALDPIS